MTARGPGEPPSDTERREARLAHDLNNLVSVILGYASLLVEQLATDAPARRMAQEVATAATQAAQISRELVELKRAPRTGAPVIPPAEPRAGGSPYTILVLEDDHGVRRLAESILKRAGYQVLGAADAAAATSLCDAHATEIELLLADVQLLGDAPRDRLAPARARRPAMRVLYMSGCEASSAPADGGFLAKPFTAESLLQRVRETLGLSREVART